MSELPESFCKEFEQALADSKNMPSKAALDLCMTVIWRHKLAYKFTGPCENFLTHPENRSRLMLSARNAHKLAEQIYLSGADFAQLGNAMCFEIAVEATKRKHQLEKNASLIKRAGGLLAEMTGAERFITVGCGHTASLCKHAQAGGRTSSKVLQDANGYMDMAKLKKDAKFKQMLENGWEWDVVKAAVDLAYPSFSKLAQQACNSSNSNRQQTSEPELICQLTEYYLNAKQNGESDPKAAALEALQDQSKCASYAYLLLEYAMKFGGGDEVPYVRFLDSMTKQFGTTKDFGETFWEKALNTKFPQSRQSITEHFPLLRLCMLVVQGIMGKAKDAIACFLTVNDWKKASSKPKAEQARELEKLLTEAMKLTELIDKDFLVTYQKAIGQLMVRAGLMITDKQAKGPEEKEYNIGEIKRAYLDDLSSATGQVVTYAPWSDFVSESKSADDAKDDTRDRPQATDSGFKNLASYTSVGGKLKDQLGFTLGAVVAEKGAEGAPNFWTVVELLNENAIIMQRVFDYSGTLPADRIKVDVDVLKKNWKVVKEPTTPFIIATKQHRPEDAIQLELLRGDAFKALVALDKQYSKKTDQGIAFWSEPSGIRTTRKLAPGELVLIPFVNINMITNKNNSNKTALRICEQPVELYIQPLPKTIALKDGANELPDGALAAAFWTVMGSHTTDADAANMTEIEMSKGCFNFKALTNQGEVQAYKQLVVYKPPEAKAPAEKLQGAYPYRPDLKRRRITKS